MGGNVLNWRACAPSLLLLLAGCSGGGFDALSTPEAGEPPPHGDEPAAPEPETDEPNAPPAGGPPLSEPPANDPAGPPAQHEPSVEDAASSDPDLCRFLVLHDESGEVAVTFADGSARSLAHDDAFIHQYGADVATIGSYAIVGIAAEDFQGDPTLTFFHAELGTLWRGTQPNPSDYTRAMGFQSITREGFALLNDGSVLDAYGAQHQSPDASFVPALANIDREGYVLVSNAGALAYWDVVGDRIDRAPTEGVGRAIAAPVALGGVEGSEVAFVEDLGGGAVAFTQLSRDQVARAPLSAAAAQLVQSTELGELWLQNDSYEGEAVLLTASRRPLAWMHAGRTPIAIEGGAELPPGDYPHSEGGCFTGTSTAAATADELIASLWRVNTEDGAFEKGLRFAIPTGLALEVPLDGATYSQPRCAGDGRMAVLLRGLEGLAWFAEGDSALERITDWTPELPGEPQPTYPPQLPASERRIIGTWSRPSPPERCEHRYENDGMTLIDHEHGVEHFVPGFTTVSWLDDAEPAP